MWACAVSLAFWCLSGIYRDVTLRALLLAHLQDYTVRTRLRPDGAAEVALEVMASAPGIVGGKLPATEGREVKAFELEVGKEGKGAVQVGLLPESHMLEFVGQFDAFLCGDDEIAAAMLDRALPRLRVISK